MKKIAGGDIHKYEQNNDAICLQMFRHSTEKEPKRFIAANFYRIYTSITRDSAGETCVRATPWQVRLEISIDYVPC